MGYDEDMESRRVELEEMSKNYEVECAEYAELKEYFDKIDADLSREKEENDILAAVARREAFARMVFYKAANRIQNIARGRQARHRAHSMKSKGKKGKKGKK